MDETRLELKVGALLLAALVGTLGLLLLMGELSFGGSTRVQVDFSHTTVVRGAPVKLGGVPVGRVEDIQLFPERRDGNGDLMPVTVTCSLNQVAAKALRKDLAMTVSSQGPLGEPYFELNPGVATEKWDLSKPIRGTDSPRIDLVSNKLARFLEAASKVLEEDPDALAHLVSGVSGLTRTVDGVLTENRAELRQITVELAAAAKDLREISAMAKKQLSPGGQAVVVLDDVGATAKHLRGEVPKLTAQANTALGGVAAITGKFTEEDGVKLKTAIARYTAAGEKLDGIAARADRMLARIEAGEGTLGATIKDKQVYDDLKELLSDLKKHPWKVLWKD